MVNFCAVVGCANRADRNKDKSFYRLPAIITHQGEKTKELSESRRRGWLAAIRRQDIKPGNYPHIRVCSDHFISGKPADMYNSTSPDWIPSLCLGHNHAQQVDSSRHTTAAERDAKRKKLQEDQVCAASKETEGSDDDSQIIVSAATEEGVVDNKLKKAKEEVCGMTMEEAKMKEELAAIACSEKGFENDDDKVCYYTGLPGWKILLVVFNFLEPCLSSGGHASLTAFQQVLMTLMCLRLNLPGQDLAYRFGVNESTISLTFLQVIEVLYVRLKHLILWPDRDVLQKTMPMTFRKHCPNCVVIINWFEIFIDRPSNLLARAQTHSSHEHRNTAKYLIGMTPQGTVSFISEGWGGMVSDKHLIESSDLLNRLVPGDVVLADRDLDTAESVGVYCAQVSLPFTRGKRQLDRIDGEQARRIANVRIHVERLIGVLRQKYAIFSGTQPNDFLIPRDDGVPILDKIVSVCCSLVNVCDSVVPFD